MYRDSDQPTPIPSPEVGFQSVDAAEEISALEIAQIAKETRGITHALRSRSFTEVLPRNDEIAEPLSEKESPGPWSTYYFPSRCINSECDLCSVCGYTVLRQDISQEEITASIMTQANQFLDHFQENVVEKQYGKMVRQGVENPIGLTLSPTGSFFAENEFPAANRLQVLRRILTEAQQSQVNLVFTAEAHARDITSKTQFNYFDRFPGKEEAELLRALHAQIILGFESRNDFVRNGIYNKNLSLKDFEKASHELQNQELAVGAFVFSGLAPMTDLEAKNDALKTIQYLLQKDIFPVLMFANIQPNTVTDVLRANDRYKMLEPFTVIDTIEAMLNLIATQKPESNWLVPDPVGGPPDPVFNIFINRHDVASSETTNQFLCELIYRLRNDRDTDNFKKELARIHQTSEYQNYLQTLKQQETTVRDKNLLTRTQAMLNFLQQPEVIEAYLKNEKES